MLGFAEDGHFVPTGGVQPGDRIVQVGFAPVEGAAVLAQEAVARLRGLEADVLARAADAVNSPGISIVAHALRAAALGAKAMHDPTEGGLASGLHELAEASGVRLVVREQEVLWFEPGLSVCEALGADPWGTLASGSLLAAFPEQRAVDACRALGEIAPARVIGTAEPGSGVVRDSGEPIPRFDRDEVARVLADSD
jgi:hydrogenase maturation factor